MVISPSPFTAMSILSFCMTSGPTMEGCGPPTIIVMFGSICLAIAATMHPEVKFCDFTDIPITVG